ncbi:MAG: hypothetical protein JNJ83_02775 [Verrucomicrobiaceae bacterium]|nr:hypothetical protein [Verrucomicrobiaceae bacterium]
MNGLCFTLYTLVLAVALHAEEPRTFTAADGRTLKALPIAKNEHAIIVWREGDWQQFTLALDSLSPQDKEFVDSWEPPIPQTNEAGNKVLAFCQQRIGRRVGKGQCAHLSSEALKHLGPRRRPPDFPAKGDYVWGDLVAFIRAGTGGIVGLEALSKVQPGDIVQIRNACFEGSWLTGGTYLLTTHHHTTVVEKVRLEDGVLHILHQNVKGVFGVTRGTHELRRLKSGWLRIYRPVVVTASPNSKP